MAERKRLPRRAIAGVAGAALVLSSAALALGPGAAWIVDQFADGQRVWRLGRIQIDGVSGAWLGELRAAHVTLEDAEGVWLEAENVALDWRPLALLGGGVWLNQAHADVIRVLRRPALASPRATGGHFDVRIDTLSVSSIELAKPVAGAAAQFTATLRLDVRDKALRALDFAMQRSDSDSDSASVLYRAGGDYAMLVNVAGAPGGVISRVLGVPEQSVRLQAVGDGDLQTGGARYEGAIGEADLLHGETRWTPAGWRTQGEARLDLLPALQLTARRIGASVTLDASGARAGAFTANATTPFLAVELHGALDEAGELDGAARFIATTRRISDIAREAPFEFGPARMAGQLRQANGVFAIRAQLDAPELDVLGRRTSLAGALEATLAPDQFMLSADLRAPDQTPPLFAQARLRTSLDYDRRRGRFSLNRTALEGDAFAIDAQGWVNDGDGEFSGAWRVKNLGALAGALRGSASGRWRAHAEPGADDPHTWITALDGAGADLSGEPAIAPQLLGGAPQLDGLFRYENGGISVDHLRIEGRQLRAAASGRIVRGVADLALEASARGPLSFGAAEIGGVACAGAEEATRGADIVCTVTGATEPVLRGAWLQPGAFVAAVGAPRPNWRELDDAAMANILVVDSRESAEHESGDVILSGAKPGVEIGTAAREARTCSTKASRRALVAPCARWTPCSNSETVITLIATSSSPPRASIDEPPRSTSIRTSVSTNRITGTSSPGVDSARPLAAPA